MTCLVQEGFSYQTKARLVGQEDVGFAVPLHISDGEPVANLDLVVDFLVFENGCLVLGRKTRGTEEGAMAERDFMRRLAGEGARWGRPRRCEGRRNGRTCNILSSIA